MTNVINNARTRFAVAAFVCLLALLHVTAHAQEQPPKEGGVSRA